MSDIAPILLGDGWRTSVGKATFQADEPATGKPLSGEFPISPWSEIDLALTIAESAFDALTAVEPRQRAEFLERYAAGIESRSAVLVETANRETALPIEPRLLKVELPRTVTQLRQCAKAAIEQSWCLPTIDTINNIRSMLLPIGPVVVFGPNNFPFAFNAISGGDFAAAIAAGNPVIAKAHPCHPQTSRLLAEAAFEAAKEVGMPAGTVQMLYAMDAADGEKLVADDRVGAVGFTGSRKAGLALKRAADPAGKPIYLELGSVNPVVMLPGALAERGPAIAVEFIGSALMGCGQFCTNPGIVFLIDDASTTAFIEAAIAGFNAATPGTLLSAGVFKSLEASVAILRQAGAEVLAGGKPTAAGRTMENTLLKVPGRRFLENATELQTEAFGNSTLLVICRDAGELRAALGKLEGNLTGSICSAHDGRDDTVYPEVATLLRRKVGRLLNDKMPTGVALSPGMNHGGPFPAAWHPAFSAVGAPGSLRRFGQLACFDGVRPGRLPDILKDSNLPNQPWRFIDGGWTNASVSKPG